MRDPTFHLSIDAAADQMTVLAYGLVWHDSPPRVRHSLGRHPDAGILHLGMSGPALGFRLPELHSTGLESLDDELVWDGPRFTVPALAQANASIGELVLAARARYRPGAMTADQESYLRAMQARHDDCPEDAEHHWRRMLEAGATHAHKGLGCTLCDLGRYREGYAHLRYYAAACPTDPHGLHALGLAAEASGEPLEAMEAFGRSIAAEHLGATARDATIRLAGLRARIQGDTTP